MNLFHKVGVLLCVAGSFPCHLQGAAGREVLPLNGTWKIVFDPHNEGRERNWQTRGSFPHKRARDIEVPCCWELLQKDYEGVAFYFRSFTVPDTWKEKVVRLQFDAVNFRAEVFLNDTAVGQHEGGFTPFEFPIGDLLRYGEENVLTLRVLGPVLLQQKRIDGIGPMETPQWRGAIAGGIWQPVRLVATGPAYLHDVFIEPKGATNTAVFHLSLRYCGEAPRTCTLRLSVFPQQRGEPPVATADAAITLLPGLNSHTASVRIPNAMYWSPEEPHLYRAEIRLFQKEELSDALSARFGMRHFTVRNKTFYLNGKPFYLKAVFFEGLYPCKLAYPDSIQMARAEIERAKAAGFTMIRPWRKPPPPVWLDLADQMGVLTVGTFAIECMGYPVQTARLPHWVEAEIRQTVLRDRNHPCVVMWELFNEITRPVLKRLLRPMAVLARRLDPTRLIVDESGGWAQGAQLYLPYRFEPLRFNDIHHYPGPHITEETFTKLLLTGEVTHRRMRRLGLRGPLPGRNVVPHLMTYFSELGYGSLPDLEDNNRRFARAGNLLSPPARYHRRLAEEHRRVLRETGFDSVWPTLREFCLAQQYLHGCANKRMIEGVRCNPQVKGYCVHALTAGDWILGAGLLDLFRRPKTYAYEATKAANKPRVLVIRLRPRNVYAQLGTELEILAVNELDPVAGALHIAIRSENARSVFKVEREIRLGSGIASLYKRKLSTESLSGTYHLHATVLSEAGSTIAENSRSFVVWSPGGLTPPKAGIAVYDPANRLVPFLRSRGIPFAVFGEDTDPALPVFVSRTQAPTQRQRSVFQKLTSFVMQGGTAVYLEGGGLTAPWGNATAASPLLPFRARLRRAVGTWNCVSHCVRAHPVFAALPANCMMGGVYENVCPRSALLGVKGEIIAAAIGYDWFPDLDNRKRHYAGPGATWWGATVAAVPCGKGRAVVSQLRLVENLGRDPVADRILFNLIAWAGKASQ